MKPLSSRISNMAASATVLLTTKAKEMARAGIDVVALTAGEPDFETPDLVKQAGIAAIQNGVTRYGPPAGSPGLADAIVDKFRSENNLAYERNQVVVTAGGKQAVFYTIMALCQLGDEVVVVSPYWVTYTELIKFSGAKPVVVNTGLEQEYNLSPTQLKQVISPNTKMVILNSPGNPCGNVYDQHTLAALAEVVVEHDLYVVSDEIYEKILYEQARHISIAGLNKEILEHTITINGVSKAFSMTGWRIGYLGAAEPIASAIVKLQSQASTHPSTISMAAAEQALRAGRDAIAPMVDTFGKRRKYVADRLDSIPNVNFYKPKGAFYVFPNVSHYYGKAWKKRLIQGSVDLCEYLLAEMKLSVVPGIAFGEDRCVRLSFATDMETLTNGLDRFEQGLAQLH